MDTGKPPSADAGAGRAVLPYLALLLLFWLSFVFYATALVIPYSLFSHVASAPISLPEMAERQPGPAISFLLTLLAVFAAYAAAYWVCRHHPRRHMAPLIMSCGLILALLLSLTYPGGAGDVVDYVSYGESLAFHGVNPLVIPPGQIDGTAFAQYSAYRHATSNYGPLWTWISAAVVRTMGTGSLLLNLLAFKAVAIASYALLGALIYSMLQRRRPNFASAGLLFFAWNPLVLYEFAVNGHNDATMMAFAVLGILFWDLGRPYLMVAALTLSFLVKIPPVLLLPLFLLAAARQRGAGRPFYTTLLGGGLLALALVGLAYLSLPDSTAALLNLSGRSHLFTHSLPAIASMVLRLGGLERVAAEDTARAATLLALGTWYAINVARTWRRPANVLRYACGVVLFLLLFATPWFQPWYVTWLVALAALLPVPAAPALAGTFSLTVMFSYVVYGFVWFWAARLANWGHTLGINLIAVGTSYLVPWTYGAWLWLRGRRTALSRAAQE